VAALPQAGGPLRADSGGGPLPPAAVKWACIAAALRMGVGLLVLEPDSVLFADPFSALYRDADFEALADGWDETSVWGYDHVVDDPTMGWSRYCHGTRMSTRDPGLMLAQATEAGAIVALRVARRLALSGPGAARSEREVFNQETWLPSHGSYVAGGASLRVMNFLCFANSKNLMRLTKDDALQRAGFAPIAARFSYHAPKAALAAAALLEFGPPRQKGAMEAALKAAAAGGRGARPAACAAFAHNFHRLRADERAFSPVVARVVAASNWTWAGIKPFNLQADGVLLTPWGTGEWGVYQPASGTPADGAAASTLLASFGGAEMVLEFEEFMGEQHAMFVATRCSDGDLVIGRPA